MCRANKVCKRKGLGYLVAWLQAGPGVLTREAHKKLQEDLLSPNGFHERRDGRKYLTDRAARFSGLLDLERKYNPSLEEPLKVLK